MQRILDEEKQLMFREVHETRREIRFLSSANSTFMLKCEFSIQMEINVTEYAAATMTLSYI